jgi:peptidoglycan/xylan/chitin deacetylase (PgdA/CDA1 family)
LFYVFFMKRTKLLLILAFLLIGLVFLGVFLEFFPGSGHSVNVLEPIYQGSTHEKSLALAVNVDWGEDVIPQMLEIFEQEKIRATFFVTGRFADKFPEIVKEIDRGGHEVGNHGYSHNHPDRTGFGVNQKEIIRTEEALKKIIDNPVKLYAPPYGESSRRVVEAAGDLGYKTIMWTIDTVDWKEGSTVQGIAHKVVSKAQNGAIVLMHPREVTVKALPIIIEELKAQGYQFKKISQIIAGAKSQNN